MRDPGRWAKIVRVAGGVCLAVGSLDPLEGFALILPGSALLALGSHLGREHPRTVAYRTWSFLLIALGVGALFGLSANGGVGGDSGRSMWWAVLILPYAIGWSLDLWGPGTARWITMAGVGVGLWFVVIAGLIVWRGANFARGGQVVPAIAIAALGTFTLVACAVRLRIPPRAAT